ncbi:MAG: S41 family peptidase [Armatimonadetes bacterium]|nr:S41 family peptidase [Armatimonadota bacterium]
MMRKLSYVLPFTLLLTLAFLVGFIAPDVSASWGNRSHITAQLRLLPDRLEMLANPPDKPDTELPVLQTYYEVLGKLRDNYYGKTIDERQLTYSAIRGMLQALNDPYTRFLDPDSYKHMREENEGNFVGIGAKLDVNKQQQVYIKEPLPNTPAEKAGVKAGDIIIKVDEKPIAGLEIDEVVERIRGHKGTKVKLSLLRGTDEKSVDIMIVRDVVEIEMVQSKMIDPKGKIGYIRLHGFNEHSDGQFEQAITQLERQRLKGLILDLRQNPGGLLQTAIDIGSRFVESGPIVIIQNRGGRKEPLNVDASKHNHKRYPLVVLVDKQSASASEIVAGAIQDNKAGTIVGTSTFGKARVQTVSALNDGSAIAITTAKYLTPKGVDINKVGIKPDVEIEGPDMFEIGDPKEDVQLAKALEIMKGNLAPSKDRSSVAKEPAHSTERR